MHPLVAWSVAKHVPASMEKLQDLVSLTNPDTRNQYVDKLRPFIVRTLGFDPRPQFGPVNENAPNPPIGNSDPDDVSRFKAIVNELIADGRQDLLWEFLCLVGPNRPAPFNPGWRKFLLYIIDTNNLSAAMTLVESCYGEIPPAALDGLLKHAEAISDTYTAIDLLELITPQVSHVDWRAEDEFKNISLEAILGFMSSVRRETRERMSSIATPPVNDDNDDKRSDSRNDMTTEGSDDKDPSDEDPSDEHPSDEDPSDEDPSDEYPSDQEFPPFTNADAEAVFDEDYEGSDDARQTNRKKIVKILERYRAKTGKKDFYLGPDMMELIDLVGKGELSKTHNGPDSYNNHNFKAVSSLLTHIVKNKEKLDKFISRTLLAEVCARKDALNAYFRAETDKVKDQQLLTVKQIDNWEWWEDIVKGCSKDLRENPSPDVIENMDDYELAREHQFQHLLVVDHNPTRLDGFHILRSSKIDSIKGPKNFIRDGKLICQRYKTAWKYKEYVFDTLPAIFFKRHKQMEDFVEKKAAEGRWDGPYAYHEYKTMEKFNSRGTQILQKMFKRIFHKEFSVIPLRIARIDYGKRTGELEWIPGQKALAKDMHHDPRTQQTTYTKRIDIPCPHPKVKNNEVIVVDDDSSDSASGSSTSKKRKGKAPATVSNKRQILSESETEIDEMDIDDDIGKENEAQPSHGKPTKSRPAPPSPGVSSRAGQNNNPDKLAILRQVLPNCVRSDGKSYDWPRVIRHCKRANAELFKGIKEGTLQGYHYRMATKDKLEELDRIFKEMEEYIPKARETASYSTVNEWPNGSKKNFGSALNSGAVFGRWKAELKAWRGEHAVPGFKPLDF